MSAVFSTLGDARAAHFRVREAARGDGLDRKTEAEAFADKLRDGGLAFSLDPEQEHGARAAIAALEEAKRIASPKAAAQQKLAEVEQRMQELRQEARIAAARGDREKLAQLAQEAAQLARIAGRAAKDFSLGVSAAAVMGKGGGDVTTTTITTSVTTITVARIEATVELRIGAGGAGGADALAAGALNELPVQAPTKPPSVDELAAMMDKALALATRMGAPAPAAPDVRDMVQRAFQDNAMKMSRWKEADAFGRRVEGVIADAKAVLGEAKRANETDEDHRRRTERRKMLDEEEKGLDAAREAVADLRASAFGSGLTPADYAQAMVAALTPQPAAAPAPVAVDVEA